MEYKNDLRAIFGDMAKLEADRVKSLENMATIAGLGDMAKLEADRVKSLENMNEAIKTEDRLKYNMM